MNTQVKLIPNWNVTNKITSLTAFVLVVLVSICIPVPSESRRSWGLRSRDANPIRAPVSRLNQCCNSAGVVNAATACSSTSCLCKPNVQGVKCEECKAGYYNLDAENPDGCSICYCFGATDKCTGSNWPAKIIKTLDGWLVTDLAGAKVVEPDVHPTEGHLVVANDELPGVNSYYWDAPQEYLGSKLYSYGGDIRFVLSYVVGRGDTSGWYTRDPDVILQGGPQNIRIGYNWKKPRREEEGKTIINLPLREQGWFKVNPDGSNSKQPVSREEFTLIAYNLKRLLVRAKFHTDQIEGGLHSVDMDIANNTTPTGKIAKGTEMCQCPEGYAGLSCELCAPGYRRVNNTLVNGQCVKCDCNGHSPSCDPFTGRCSICLHHTTGEKCDRCQFGYYGDPRKGTEYDCKPCACPLPIASNNFSPSCYASESTPGGYICDACPKGYTGDRCDRCAEGYWGNPTIPGGKCVPCDCGPDADTTLPGWCDHRTGQCLKCRGTIDRECKKCPPRHVLTSRGCQKCEDPCVDQILDDLDAFGRAANEANLTGIKDLPRIRLRWMEHQVNKTAFDLRRYQYLIDEGQRLLQNVSYNFDLEALADILYLRAKQLESRGAGVSENAVRVGIEAEELLDLIHDLLDELNRVIDSLRRYGLDVPGSGIVATDRLLMEAERILRELQLRNQQPNIDAAEREVRKAKHLLTRVNQLVTSPGTSNELRERLEKIRRLLSEFINIVQDQIQSPTLETFKKIQESHGLYEYVTLAISNSSRYSNEAKAALSEAHSLLDSAKAALIESAVQFGLVPRIKEELDNITNQLEVRRSILARLNPHYTEQYVKPCISHVLELKKRLLHIIGLFNATREVSASPMQAATVYDKIVNALTAAEIAARTAYSAADRAYLKAYPGTDDALIKQASAAREKSYALLEEAKNLRTSSLPELERDLGKKKFLLDSLKEDLSNTHRNIDLINKVLDSLPTSLSKSLRDSDTLLKQVLEGIRDSIVRIEFVDQRIRGELTPKLDRLKEGSASGLENLTRILDKARSDTKIASRYALNAEEINERVSTLSKAVFINLKELKDRILLSRQKASSIKVSLGTDYPRQECIRSFKPDIEPSTTNTIVLNYAIKDEAKDALLFYISSSTTDDFMAIEMVERKIRFLWNAGGGTQVITHNLVIETNDPSMNKDNQWYKIMVTRVGNVATLKVKRTPESDEPDENEVTGSSPPNFNRMDFDSNSFLFISGLPSEFRAPRELRSRKFAGCMYEVLLDGKKIGLWNFKSNYGCRGCKEGATEPRDPSTFSFRGDASYAILNQIKRYDRKKYLIVLQFKTFDEDALLFFTGNKVTGDFVSLSLKGGKVIYQFNMGSTSRLTLTSRLKYNTGQWVRLAAERDKLEGILSVDDELLEGKVPTSGPTSLELGESVIYYGGVPPNFTFELWPTVTFKPFLGCMKDLQVDSSPLGLSKSDSYGIEAGCRSELYSISTALFLGGPSSFIELKSKPLREEADFSFTFKTNQTDALLILSTFEGQRGSQRDAHYYSVAIVGGLLEGRFNGGSGETPLISESRVNDGTFHTVSVSKRNRRVAMSLDDIEIGASRLAKGSNTIEAPTEGGLYLGGLPSTLTLNGRAGTRESLKGVIRDLVFNKKPYKFNNPIKFEAVSIGREADPDVFVNLGQIGVIGNETDISTDGGKLNQIDIHLINNLSKNLSVGGNRVDFKSVDDSIKFTTKSTDELNVNSNSSKNVNSGQVNQVNLNQEKNEIGFNSVESKSNFNLDWTRGWKEPKLESKTESNQQEKQFILLNNFDSTEFTRANFNLSFEFRTGHLNGFLFLIPGKIVSNDQLAVANLSSTEVKSNLNQPQIVNYIAVSLKSGQLVVNLREFKKPILFVSGNNLANDEWHIVVIKKTLKYFSVQIDTGHEMLIELNLKKNYKLHFEPTILFGGTIETLGSNIGGILDEIFGHKGWTSHVLIINEFMAHKFKGCLREFKLNGKSVNLITKDTSLGVNCN